MFSDIYEIGILQDFFNNHKIRKEYKKKYWSSAFLYYTALFIVGKSPSHTGLAKRVGHLLRPTYPKSPRASASTFESVEGDDEEDDINENINLVPTYLHKNGNIVTFMNFPIISSTLCDTQVLLCLDNL